MIFNATLLLTIAQTEEYFKKVFFGNSLVWKGRNDTKLTIHDSLFKILFLAHAAPNKTGPKPVLDFT